LVVVVVVVVVIVIALVWIIVIVLGRAHSSGAQIDRTASHLRKGVNTIAADSYLLKDLHKHKMQDFARNQQHKWR